MSDTFWSWHAMNKVNRGAVWCSRFIRAFFIYGSTNHEAKKTAQWTVTRHKWANNAYRVLKKGLLSLILRLSSDYIWYDWVVCTKWASIVRVLHSLPTSKPENLTTCDTTKSARISNVCKYALPWSAMMLLLGKGFQQAVAKNTSEFKVRKVERCKKCFSINCKFKSYLYTSQKIIILNDDIYLTHCSFCIWRAISIYLSRWMFFYKLCIYTLRQLYGNVSSVLIFILCTNGYLYFILFQLWRLYIYECIVS